MDYKAPPQYSTPPPGQQAVYPPQGQPQYGSPSPQQVHAYPPQQTGVVQYGTPPPQQHAQAYPPQQHPQQFAPQQHPQQYPPQQHPQQYPPQQHPQQYPPQQHPQQHPQQPQPQPQQRAIQQQPQQYAAQQPMQRAVVGAGPGVANKSEWNHSLMDCSPCDSCCLGTFLPCVLLGKTADRMRDPTMQGADSMNSDCMVFLAIHCFTGCGWIYIMMKRGEIRERFGIQGDGTADCCATYWCPCCSLIQQDNEVKTRTAHLVANPAQGYQAQPGMVMPQK
ncbi:hypothetical protein HMPREF1624_05250 [Sporothrix schenckii ATCC 58251]|uniref:Uncharacterized protein n=1 Tax=Sporothrix schenckii (strain ATCC 58251 / de Perez 2211183) TaxID=1391915 RepID=U7PU69_SPOS1|nr:hypothetical protein HMPREF1624_05250 [Sporothrix schenckii ATCC 58251]